MFLIWSSKNNNDVCYHDKEGGSVLNLFLLVILKRFKLLTIEVITTTDDRLHLLPLQLPRFLVSLVIGIILGLRCICFVNLPTTSIFCACLRGQLQ